MLHMLRFSFSWFTVLPCVCSRQPDKSVNVGWESSKRSTTKTHDYEVLLALFKTSTMCKGATWRWMETEGEGWRECREKEGRSDRERRSSPRCYCPVCQLLEGKNKENWWAVAYHMSVSLSLTLSTVIHSHTQYIHPGRCVTPLHLSCLPPTPTLHHPPASFSHILHLFPQSSPPTTATSVYPLQKQTPSSEAGGVGAGGMQSYRCRNKRMGNAPPPQVRRSLQGQYTPHLSLGAKEG